MQPHGLQCCRLAFELHVAVNQTVDSLDRSRGRKPVLRSVETIVHKAVDGRGGHVHAGVRRRVVDVDRPVGVGDPAVGKEHVHHVAHIFLTHGSHQIAAGRSDFLPRLLERGHVHVEHIAQTRGTAAHTVGQMQPPLGGLDGVGTLAVLDLFDGVVIARVDDDFLP